MELSYREFAKNNGTYTGSIILGKKYKLLSYDGVNFISLGKCTENYFHAGYYANDFNHHHRIKFEKNNDSSELNFIRHNGELQFWGESFKINIYLDDD